jgi:hypothetical protein
MHDSATLAFSINIGKWHFITVWHVDPERDGSDDSCGWAWPHLTRHEAAYARQLAACPYDNLVHWFAGVDVPGIENEAYLQRCREDEVARRIAQIFRLHKWLSRPWWRHPRWHIWHWRVQVHPWQNFCRWAFSRCAVCGEGFRWGYAPVSSTWHNRGPRFLRGEKDTYHHECYPHPKQ